LHQRKYDEAAKHLSEALRGMPKGLDKQYNAVNMQHKLGMALFYDGKQEEGTAHLSEAVRLDPKNAKLHYSLATALAVQGDVDETARHYTEAVSIKPEIDTSATLHNVMALNYARAGRFPEAVSSAEKALELARAAGNDDLAQQIEERLEFYKQDKPYEP
jgi:Flp pilus assembly protein TadD